MNKRNLKTCEYLKVANIQNVYLNGKKVTLFNVYQLLDNSCVFDYNEYISGLYKKADTVLDKILNKIY